MKITKRDFENVADSIKSELSSREVRRKDLEAQWKEVDRQVAMKAPVGEKLPGQEWRTSFELPLQAQAHEVLTADAERLRFPEEKDWFKSHCALTDDFLNALQERSAVFGVEDGLQEVLANGWSQENCDELINSILIHYHSNYDFRGAVGHLDAQAFKYGAYVGFPRLVKRSVYTKEFVGVYRDDEKIPVLVPGDIRNTYLDDSPQEILKEGIMVAPSIIRKYSQKATDIMKAAKGTGGWVKGAVSRLDPKKDVEIIEFMGDLVIPRSQRNGFIPNQIVTIGNNEVLRVRDIDAPFRPVIYGTYHSENLGPYGTSPLMKGAPIQKAASETARRLIDAGILNVAPPISHDPHDQYIAGQGGPNIAPNASWPKISGLEVHQIGDPSALLQVYMGLLKQYEDMTGVSAPRLGAQTKSHQTAFAIDAEMTRGQTRTVDYVNGQKSVLGTILHMELSYLRKSMPKTPIYIEKYGGFVNVDKSYIPEHVVFEILGTSAPMADREKEQRLMASIQMAVQLDPLAAQNGERRISVNKVQEELLRRAEPTFDIEKVLSSESAESAAPSQGLPAQSQVDPGILAAIG